MKRLFNVLVPYTVLALSPSVTLADKSVTEAYPAIREIVDQYNANCLSSAFFAQISELFIVDPNKTRNRCDPSTVTTQTLNLLDSHYSEAFSDAAFRNDYSQVLDNLPDGFLQNYGSPSQYSDLSITQSNVPKTREESPIKTLRGFVTTDSD